MRALRFVAAAAIVILGVTLLATAGQNKFGVSDKSTLTFTTPIRVGDVLLPKGEYQVLHTMEGQDHIMVFKQLNTRKPAEARVKCQLEPLSQRATRTQQIYVMNAANERVLRTLIFRGDTAQHQF